MRKPLSPWTVIAAQFIVIGLVVFLVRPIENRGRGSLLVFNDPAERPVLVPNDAAGYRIPTDMEDALAELMRILHPSRLAEIRRMKPDEAAGRLHFSLGMWLRHNWKLWDWGDGERSAMREWFNEQEIHDGDMMSGIILDNFARKLHGLPLRYEAQIAEIRKRKQASPGPSIHLPRVGTVGPSPADLARGFDQRMVRVTIDAEGGLTIRRVEYSGQSLAENLFVHADAARDLDHPQQASLIYIMIRPDRSAPWSSVRDLIDACRNPAVRIPQLIFEVESEFDEEPGTLAAYLPLPFAPEDHPDFKSWQPPGQTQVTLRWRDSEPPDLGGLFGDLTRLDPAWKTVPAMIRPDDYVPAEVALRAFDLLLRAGAKWVIFGPPPEEGTPRGVTINGTLCVAGDDPLRPAPVPRAESMVGVVEPPPLD